MSIYLSFTLEFYFMLSSMQHTIFTQQFFAVKHFMCHNEGHFIDTVIIMDFRAYAVDSLIVGDFPTLRTKFLIK